MKLTIELGPDETFEGIMRALNEARIAAHVEHRDDSETLIYRAEETAAQLRLSRPSRISGLYPNEQYAHQLDTKGD